jgi:hypothetical protein
LLERVERERRVIIDADGMYNEMICVGGYDRNHADPKQQIQWRRYYEALSDRIFQPTRRPLSSKVAPLLFYGYDHLSLTNQNHTPKKWDLVHVGHNWWRWKQIRGTLIPALEQIRGRLNGVCFVGSWWDQPPSWASQMGLDEAFLSDHKLMERLPVQIEPAVSYREVIATMSQGRINIMTQRPLFQHLRFVTSKYFEIFCADTIPLVMLPPDQAEEVYGPGGREIALHDNIAEKLADVLDHMDTYRDVVREIRRHLEIHHSYHRRIQELVDALESRKASLAVQGVIGP